jgi:dissimilatory sulfite reductase (desulfoviridin) alpha/beta subunit
MVLNNQKKFLSPEDIDVLAEIVERYGLGPTEFFGNPEVERMLSEAKTPEERIKIIKNLPFIKIMSKLEEILSGKALSKIYHLF